MLADLTRLLVRRRRETAVAVAVVTLAAATLAVRIPFDFTPQALFAGRDDLVAFSDQVKARFGHSDNVVLVVQAAVADDDLLTPAALQWHRALCRELAQLPAVERVDGIGVLRLPRFRPLGGLFTGAPVMLIPVLNSGPIDEAEAALVRRKVAGQRLIEGVLVSRDRRAAAIALHLRPDRKDIAHVAEQVAAIQACVDRIPRPEGYAAFLGGLPAMRTEIIANLKRDQLTTIPACAAAFVVIQALAFRCAAGVAIPALAVGVGLAWTLAAFVLLGQSLTVISNVLPVLLMIIGVSSCVHFLTGYAEQAFRHPDDRWRAVREAAVQLIPATFLTSLTTAMGFVSLIAARSALLRGLGWQAMLGIGLFFFAVVLVCTSMMGAFAPPWHVDRDGRRPSLLARCAAQAGGLATRRPWGVVVAGTLGLAAAGLLATRVVVDSSLLETYEDDHPEVRRMRFIEDELSGFVPLEVVLTGPVEKWYLAPDRWRQLRDFTQRVGQRSEVLLVRSLCDLFDQADALLPGGESLAAFGAAGDPRLAGRLAAIDRVLGGFGRTDPQGLPSYLAEDGRTLRVALRLRDVGAQGNLRLKQAVEGDFAAAFSTASAVDLQITGESYVASAALLGFIRELLGSLLGVSAIIFVVIAGLLKSLRLGLVAVAPNVAPLAATAAYLVIRGYPLNVGNVIVFAISLGIAVDDTIHFLTRFRHELHHVRDVQRAIEQTCLNAGRAIIMTTVLIVCGLAVLATSRFLPTRRFAELAAVTMVAALAGDLLLLPALVKLFVPSLPPLARAPQEPSA